MSVSHRWLLAPGSEVLSVVMGHVKHPPLTFPKQPHGAWPGCASGEEFSPVNILPVQGRVQSL